MGEKIVNLNLSDNDKQYIDSIVDILNKGYEKQYLAEQIKPIIDKYSRVPINGLIGGLVVDLECHLGLYSSDINDFKFKKKEYSFSEGIEHFISTFKLVRKSLNFELPDNIYDIYMRWIVYEDETIEVKVLFSDHWNYDLLKDINEDSYYFSILLNISAAYWSKIFKVNDKDKPLLKIAVEAEDKPTISSMAKKIKDKYFATEYKNNKP